MTFDRDGTFGPTRTQTSPQLEIHHSVIVSSSIAEKKVNLQPSEFKRLNGDIVITNFTIQKCDGQKANKTRNSNHRQAAAKPAACAKP